VSAVKTPLYGHDSEATAYLVADYPYSFKLRCRIRYWIETNPKHGFRFVSQTENPKTGRWNKPKPSTYVNAAAAMYLDEEGHVKWHGVGSYTSPETMLAFIQDFPFVDVRALEVYVKMAASFAAKYASGEAYFTINGTRCEESDADRERHSKDAAQWLVVVAELDKIKGGLCRKHDDCQASAELAAACMASTRVDAIEGGA
jgi:hypothetical protein